MMPPRTLKITVAVCSQPFRPFEGFSDDRIQDQNLGMLALAVTRAQLKAVGCRVRYLVLAPALTVLPADDRIASVRWVFGRALLVAPDGACANSLAWSPHTE